jgi:hypothetical protein
MLFNVSSKFSLVSATSGTPALLNYQALWPSFSVRTITDLTEGVRTLLRTDVEQVKKLQICIRFLTCLLNLVPSRTVWTAVQALSEV